jgi:hypothetical protein
MSMHLTQLQAIASWDVVGAFASSFMGAFTFLTLRRIRRLEREWTVLNMVYTEACKQAFLQRHLPIWKVWSAATGMSFKIVVEDATHGP